LFYHPHWVSISTLTMFISFLCSVCFIIHTESVFRHWQCFIYIVSVEILTQDGWKNKHYTEKSSTLSVSKYWLRVDDKTNTTQKTNKHCQCRNTDSLWMIKQTLHRKIINIVSVEMLVFRHWQCLWFFCVVFVLSSTLSQYFDTDNVY
jgi:hypothetical protein